jgi:hypothetical protein
MQLFCFKFVDTITIIDLYKKKIKQKKMQNILRGSINYTHKQIILRMLGVAQ